MISLVGLMLLSVATARGQVRYASRIDEENNEQDEGPAGPQYTMLSLIEHLPEKLTKTISLQLTNVGLEEALRRIAAMADLHLVYGRETVAVGRKVTLHREAISAGRAFQQMLRGTGLGLVLSSSGRLIVVPRPEAKIDPRGLELRPVRVQRAAAKLLAPRRVQMGAIVGTVTGAATGDPIPGVNVMIAGTQQGAATDADGHFRIPNVEPGTYTLRASFVGYADAVKKEMEVDAGEAITARFSLRRTNVRLDETVVMGYRVRRERDLTGAVTTLEAGEINHVPVANFQSALQGKVPGVRILPATGLAGAPVTVRIRGTASVGASSRPLYVIDGVPVITGNFSAKDRTAYGTNALATINPNAIASITVLKDAAATAIYGARGANGVVLITTKRGRAGQTQIEARYSTGFQTATRMPDLLSGPEYLKLLGEALRNSGYSLEHPPPGALPPGITLKEARDINTNWPDRLLRTGRIREASLSASGGDAATRFYVGGSFFAEEGYLVDNAFRRISGRINASHTVFDRLTISGKLGVTHTAYSRVPTAWAGGLGTAMSRSLPITPVRLESGAYWNPTGGTNVVAEANSIDYDQYDTRILGVASAAYELPGGFTFKSLFGVDMLNQRELYYRADRIQPSGLAWAEARTISAKKFNLDNTLTYTVTLGEHQFDGVFGISYERYDQHDAGVVGEGAPAEGVKNPRQYAHITDVYSFATAYAFLSYFGTVNYQFLDRYLLGASLRADGSSRFGPDKRYGFFPAISAGWILSEEAFLQDVDVLSFLKLRASYGVTGNAGIGNFEWQQLYYTGVFYRGLPGTGPANLGNEAFSWETTRQLDVGLEFGLLSGRITGGIDYYRKRSEGLLLDVKVRPSSGFTSVRANAGSLTNWGGELYVTSHNLTGAFAWTTRLNLGANRNVVTDINEQQITGENFGNNIAIEGEPIGTWYLPEWAGVDPETGQSLFYRNQGPNPRSTTTDYNQAAFIPVGRPQPTFYGGLTNTFRYKGFDLSLFFNFSVGRDIYDDAGKFLAGGFDGNWTQYAIVKNRWQEPGDRTNVPRLRWRPPNRFWNSTRYLHDAAYLRLKALTLGYDVPAAVAERLGAQQLRFFFHGRNLLLFTKYAFGDPEVNRDTSGNITQSVTYLSPPQARTLTFGVELSF